MTSPATVLSRGKTPDLRSVTFDGATAGLRGGGAPAALELLSRSELTAWHLSLQNETQSFNSLAIYGELRLREALLLETDPDEFYSNAPHRAAKGDYERTILPDMEANGGRTAAAALNAATPWFEVCAQLRSRLESYAAACRRNQKVAARLYGRWNDATLKPIVHAWAAHVRHERRVARLKMKLYCWAWHCIAMKSVRYKKEQDDNFARALGGPAGGAAARHPGIPEGDKEKALRERGERDAKDHALENVLDDFAVAESLPEDPAEAREALELRIRLAFEAGYKLGKDQGGPRFVTGKAPPPKKAPPPPPPPAAARPRAARRASLGRSDYGSDEYDDDATEDDANLAFAAARPGAGRARDAPDFKGSSLGRVQKGAVGALARLRGGKPGNTARVAMMGFTQRQRELMELGIIGGKKCEKGMPIQGAVALIPQLLEEALRADVTAANAEAQALGKKNLVAMIIAAMAVTQLPLRTIAMNCLIRRFGMRTLAVKKLRAVVATCHEAKTRSRHKRLEAADLRSLGMLVRRYFKLLYHGVKGYAVAPATALARLLVGANRFDARLFAKAADEVIFHWTKECDPRAYDERRRQLEELARADDADATKPPWMDCDEAILLCSGARSEQTAKWTALWNGARRGARRAAVDLDCFKAIIAAADVGLEPFEVVECFKDYGETAEHIARDTEQARVDKSLRTQKALLIQSVIFRHRATKETKAGMRSPAELVELAHRAQIAMALHAWQGIFQGGTRERNSRLQRLLSRPCIFHAAEMDFYNEHVLSEDKEIHLARMLEGARGEDVNRLAFLETVVDAHGLVVGSASAKDQLRAQVRATARLSKVKRASQFLKQSATKRQSAIKEQSGDFARRYSEVEERVEHMRASHDDGRAGPELVRKAHGAGGEPGSAHATPHASPDARTLADS
ncbi:hypothetical protein JL722_14939 [Aureococcus anophagefferens]|nr:hypothetical protein JL722_14939 [Aureococcus anophagefferens]